VPISELPPHDESPAKRAILIPPHLWDELDSYEKNLQSKFIKAFRQISKDLGHPALRIEIIKQFGQAFYRARVDQQYRIHFELKGSYYAILAIGPHSLQGIG
jgi:plasmid maintenance system killer protein